MKPTIDALKEKIALLEKEKNRLQGMLDLIPGYVYLQGRDYSIPYTNSRYRRLFGSPGSRRCYEFIPGRKKPCEICPTFQIFRTRQPQEWTYTNLRGETYYMCDSYLPGENDPELICEIGLNMTQMLKSRPEGNQRPSSVSIDIVDRCLEV